MGIQGEHTAEWFDRARASLVAGVSSGFRYWGDDDTLVIDRGEGGHVYDMDGNRYIDYQLGFGPVILGHGHTEVAAAVAKAAARGTTFAMTSAIEVEAAEKVRSAVPWLDALRFTNTGTEATMHAIRLARGFTGREIVVKFEGQYHGAHDYVLFSTAGAPIDELGPRSNPVPVQVGTGIPDSIRATIRTLPFNDLDAVEALFKDIGSQVAAVIVEPMLGNFFGLMPQPGYLEGLRKLTEEHGVVLIFDEVKTGFRMALGGAQEVFGVTPDLATFAKSMGNGFPVAAIGGRGDVIQAWANGNIMQAGTYSGNGIAAAAASATIDILATGEPYRQINTVGSALMAGIGNICAEEGVPVQLLGDPSMIGIWFGDEAPKEFRDYPGHDAALYEAVVMGLIGRGVMPVDDAKEPWFTCAAHTAADVGETLEAFSDSLADALK